VLTASTEGASTNGFLMQLLADVSSFPWSSRGARDDGTRTAARSRSHKSDRLVGGKTFRRVPPHRRAVRGRRPTERSSVRPGLAPTRCEKITLFLNCARRRSERVLCGGGLATNQAADDESKTNSTSVIATRFSHGMAPSAAPGPRRMPGAAWLTSTPSADRSGTAGKERQAPGDDRTDALTPPEEHDGSSERGMRPHRRQTMEPEPNGAATNPREGVERTKQGIRIRLTRRGAPARESESLETTLDGGRAGRKVTRGEHFFFSTGKTNRKCDSAGASGASTDFVTGRRARRRTTINAGDGGGAPGPR